jgi:large subunit ribosomal protein L32
MPALTHCPQCRRLKLTHVVCPFCGYYSGREVVKIELKEKRKEQR